VRGHEQDVADVEEVLICLLCAVSMYRRGRPGLMAGVHEHARSVLAAAAHPVRAAGLYDAAEHAINESERLLLAGRFDDAQDMLFKTAGRVGVKSGSVRLRRLYWLSTLRAFGMI
jgi:hypothetical protein